jgi:hypothetical protein
MAYAYLLAYCIGCWTASAWRVSSSREVMSVSEDHDAADARFMPIGFIIAILVSPIFLPLLLITMPFSWVSRYLTHRRVAKFNRQHHDPVHIVANFFELADSVQQVFANATPTMFEAEFGMVGDICSQTSPSRLVSRAFLADDGTIFADYWSADDVPLELFTLQSIDVNGVVLETCNQSAEQQPTPSGEDGIIANHIETDELRCAIDSHRELIERHETPLLVFSADNYAEFGRYVARRGSHWRHRLGEVVTKPPTPVLQQLAVSD